MTSSMEEHVGWGSEMGQVGKYGGGGGGRE